MGKPDSLAIPFINFDNQKAEFILYGSTSTIPKIQFEDALAWGESPYQIIEGCSYEYELPEGYYLSGESAILTQSNVKPHYGRLHPNIFVGTLQLEIRATLAHNWSSKVEIEVQSIKTGYREDYRLMLNDIAEKCAELIMRHSSPVTQRFEADQELDSRTDYQRFAFLKSVLDSEEFKGAILKIQHSPVTNWKEVEVDKDIRAIRKIGRKEVRQFAAAGNRLSLPQEHPLRKSCGLDSVPTRLTTGVNSETVDTPENRFVKHVLESFLYLCSHIKLRSKDSPRLSREALLAEQQLEGYLDHSLFRSVGPIQGIPLNSPVLQRREGYREVLKSWLMAELAAKLRWDGGDDVYSGGKRDVAALYEYWLFFKLLDLIERVFKVEAGSIHDLIENTKDRLGLKLKQGNRSKKDPPPISGTHDFGTRKLKIQFNYNRTFSGRAPHDKSGSWTHALRPDYTLSIWPDELELPDAEIQDKVVHVHFDAKYKIEDYLKIFGERNASIEYDEGEEDNLSEIDNEERKGQYKRADLLKMHTYRDAIRRTAGAYILYPGNGIPEQRQGFHEIVPGLGAFAINPSRSGKGVMELENFLKQILQHVLNRASQYEQLAYQSHRIHTEPRWNLHQNWPESVNEDRGLLPGETLVMIGYFKNEQHLNWICKNAVYNWRATLSGNILTLNPIDANARLLILYNHKFPERTMYYRLRGKPIEVWNTKHLILKDYPAPSPKNRKYFIMRLAEDLTPTLQVNSWDLASLPHKPFAPITRLASELLGKR